MRNGRFGTDRHDLTCLLAKEAMLQVEGCGYSLADAMIGRFPVIHLDEVDHSG